MKNKDKNKLILIVVAVCVILCVFSVVFIIWSDSEQQVTTEQSTASISQAGTTSAPTPNTSTSYSVSGLSFSSPASDTVETTSSTLSFLGSADKAHTLYCNGAEIPVNSMGLFSIELNLQLGENVFVFSHGDTTKTFYVNYKLELISDISPTGITKGSPGAVLNISAKANKNATVYAMIGSAIKIPLNPLPDSLGSEHITFSADFSLPAYTQTTDLGSIIIYAEYNGITESCVGSTLTVIVDYAAYLGDPSQGGSPTPIYTSLYENGSRGLKTALSDNGLGKTPMCEILKDYTETTPATAADDKSSPFCTPYLKGTFDYIEGVITYEDEIMYILKSGKKVYAKDSKLLSEGYILPTNKLSIKSATKQGSSFDIIFGIDWLVPISTTIGPQEYFVGHESRPYNVSSVTCEYLDIEFKYSQTSGNLPKIPTNSIISSAQWLSIGSGDSCILRLYLVNKGRFYGYSLKLQNNGQLKLSINYRPSQKATIMLDPGHGGSDSGTYAAYSNIYERDINLSLAYKTKEVLEGQGFNVIMTRYANDDVSLIQRNEMARSTVPDLFVSIHCDGSEKANTTGTHSFYYYSYSMPLAASIHSQLVDFYSNYVYSPGSTEHANIDKSFKFYPFAVTRIEECPSVLVECGYLTNATECSVLLTESGQAGVATAIANGIILYLTNY